MDLFQSHRHGSTILSTLAAGDTPTVQHPTELKRKQPNMGFGYSNHNVIYLLTK